jgi:hypothetical protein
MAIAGISATKPAAASGRGTNRTRWAALSGILFAALIIPGILITGGSPGTSAGAATVQSWYLAHKSLVGASTLLLVLGVIAGLFFLNYVRSCFRRHEGAGWMTSLFWAGAIVFAVSGALAAGVNATFSDDPRALSADSLQLLNALQSNINYPATCVGLAVMFLGAGLVIRTTRVLPQWLAWASWVLALVAASFFLGFIAFFASGLWVIVVAITLAMRNPAPEGI